MSDVVCDSANGLDSSLEDPNARTVVLRITTNANKKFRVSVGPMEQIRVSTVKQKIETSYKELFLGSSPSSRVYYEPEVVSVVANGLDLLANKDTTFKSFLQHQNVQAADSLLISLDARVDIYLHQRARALKQEETSPERPSKSNDKDVTKEIVSAYKQLRRHDGKTSEEAFAALGFEILRPSPSSMPTIVQLEYKRYRIKSHRSKKKKKPTEYELRLREMEANRWSSSWAGKEKGIIPFLTGIDFLCSNSVNSISQSARYRIRMSKECSRMFSRFALHGHDAITKRPSSPEGIFQFLYVDLKYSFYDTIEKVAGVFFAPFSMSLHGSFGHPVFGENNVGSDSSIQSTNASVAEKYIAFRKGVLLGILVDSGLLTKEFVHESLLLRSLSHVAPRKVDANGQEHFNPQREVSADTEADYHFMPIQDHDRPRSRASSGSPHVVLTGSTEVV